jgi:hypothetical protein
LKDGILVPAPQRDYAGNVLQRLGFPGGMRIFVRVTRAGLPTFACKAFAASLWRNG